MQDIKIIHLIHADTVGGVEIGAKLAQKELDGKLDYKIKFIFRPHDNFIIKIIKFFKTIKIIINENKAEKNYIILSSLWMSHIISLIVKYLSKNVTWISFLHNTRYTNIISYLINTKITRLADKQVFDSYSTAKAYNAKSVNNERIINYFFNKYNLKKFDIKDWSNREFDFITVGTNTKKNGFLELEKFCRCISEKYFSRPKIMVITNNSNKIIDLEKLKKKLHLICDVNYELNLTNEAVLKMMTNSKIYFCLSRYEGFGITIVEALLSGCFLITTNVGEQQYYLDQNRRLILNKSNNYNLDYKYINENGPLDKNFKNAKKFLYQNVNSYTESLKRIVLENK